MYVFKLGFLDGRAGWHLARLMACYEYMISLLYRDKLIRVAEKDVEQGRATAPVAAESQLPSRAVSHVE